MLKCEKFFDPEQYRLARMRARLCGLPARFGTKGFGYYKKRALAAFQHKKSAGTSLANVLKLWAIVLSPSWFATGNSDFRYDVLVRVFQAICAAIENDTTQSSCLAASAEIQ